MDISGSAWLQSVFGPASPLLFTVPTILYPAYLVLSSSHPLVKEFHIAKMLGGFHVFRFFGFLLHVLSYHQRWPSTAYFHVFHICLWIERFTNTNRFKTVIHKLLLALLITLHVSCELSVYTNELESPNHILYGALGGLVAFAITKFAADQLSLKKMLKLCASVLLLAVISYWRLASPNPFVLCHLLAWFPFAAYVIFADRKTRTA